MKLSHEVSLPLPVNEAWGLLDDPRRLASAMPGAHLDRVDGDRLEGRVNVRIGPMNLTYEGTAVVKDRDQGAGTLSMEVAGRDQRGGGTASAKVRIQLTPDGNATTVAVETDLSLTGRPAQLGAGMVQGVAQRIFTEFAERLAPDAGSPDAGETGHEDADTIDLTGPVVYIVAAVAGIIVLALVIWLWRR